MSHIPGSLTLAFSQPLERFGGYYDCILTEIKGEIPMKS